MAVILATAGCTPVLDPDPRASAGPVASAPSAPVASDVPEPVATRLVIDGSGLDLMDAVGTVIDSVRFDTDPITARSQFTAWFGASPATTSIVSDHYCADSTDPVVTDSWGGDALRVTHSGPFWLERGVRFHVSVLAAAVGDLSLETPQGFGVGDSAEALITSIPGVTTGDPEEEGVTRVYYDKPNAEYGAYAWAPADGVLTQIISPYQFEETC